jgi:nucleoside-diphosphate-sugar epimerase
MERPMSGSREQMSLVHECVRLGLAGEEIRLLHLDHVRDWIYAGDLARAVSTLLLMEEVPHRVYNCAGHRGCTHRELLETLGSVMPVRYRQVATADQANVPAALTRKRRGPLSIERLLVDTSHRPQVNLRAGFGVYVEWARDALARKGATSKRRLS